MFITTLITLILTAFVNGATAPAEELNFYPMTSIVVDFEE